MKIVLSRTNHNELFQWYNGQSSIQKQFSCISAWKIGSAIEMPSFIHSIYTKPFENKATPYFLNSLAIKFGNPNQMPPPHQPPMTIEDWCIGLGMRLYNWASTITEQDGVPFSISPTAVKNITVGSETIQIPIWTLTNMALSLDGGSTVIDSYQVYKQYGSPMAWQYPQWKGWLVCRIRPPGYPIWTDAATPDEAINVPYSPSKNPPMGTFVWGSPFIQTGYLPPFGCLGSECPDTKPTCSSANICGIVNSDGTGCAAKGNCLSQAIAKHKLLPWADPRNSAEYGGTLFSTQYPANNPFMAYEIPAASPIILRFLGYGFETPNETKTPGQGGTSVFSGGPAADQYTQIEQLMTLVNDGGFHGYAEKNSNMSQGQLEDYLFGFYTFEEKGIPKPKSPPKNCSGGGAIAGETTMSTIAGIGAGAMVAATASATGGLGLFIAAAGGAAGGAGGYFSAKGKCSGGSGCSIM